MACVNRGVTLVFFVLEAILAVGGLGFVLAWFPFNPLYQLLIWVVVAIVYLVAGYVGAWVSAGKLDRGHDADLPDEPLLPGVTAAMPYVTSLVGVTAASFTSLVKITDVTQEVKDLYLLLSAMAMIASWAVLQVAFARQYARAYRREGGVEFPNVDEPRFIDFLYFAFTVGSSFATSDVEIVNRRMRMRVLVHGVWSFLYNTAIVAMAIGILTGR